MEGQDWKRVVAVVLLIVIVIIAVVVVAAVAVVVISRSLSSPCFFPFAQWWYGKDKNMNRNAKLRKGLFST